ncbi:MAG: hypothetical protein HUU55_20080 [Myxococcales bacterium]|nr:hypothetical protein [Myxococcales bacterium]
MRRRFTTLTGLFLIAIGISSCFKDGILNLNNGLVFNVNAKLLPAPVTITFVNANPGQNSIPDSVFLGFFGEGAGRLYTPTGGSNLVVMEGMVNIGLGKGEKPSAADPLRFGLNVDAPGYFPSTYYVTLRSLDIPQYVVVYLVEEGNFPSGVSGLKEFHQLTSTGFTSSQNLLTPLTFGKTERVHAQIQSGTQVLTAAGALITGNLQVDLLHYDNRSAVSVRAISGITESIPATGLNGQALGEVTFYPATYFSLGMNVGSLQGERLSKPIQITATLNPETFNPATGQYIAVGDELGVWRFDFNTGGWVQKGAAVVVKEANLLKVVFEQAETGVWMVGQPVDLCPTGATLAIQSGIPENACDRYFYTTLVDINTGRPLSAKWSDKYLTLENNSQITLADLPAGAVGKLRVWEGVKGCEGHLLAESQPFQACAPGLVNLQLPSLSTTGWLPLEVSVSGYCEVKGEEVELKPKNCLMYRPAGCGVYGMLADLDGGEGCVGALRSGEIYDFKTRIGDQVYEFDNIALSAGSILYPLPGGEVVTIDIELALSSAKLTLKDLPLPDDFCALIEE